MRSAEPKDFYRVDEQNDEWNNINDDEQGAHGSNIKHLNVGIIRDNGKPNDKTERETERHDKGKAILVVTPERGCVGDAQEIGLADYDGDEKLDGRSGRDGDHGAREHAFLQLQEDFPECPRIFVLTVQVTEPTFHLGRVQSAPVPPDDRKCRERDADQIQEHADERQGHVLGVNVLEAALGKVCFKVHSNAWTQIDAAKHLERPRAELGV